MKDTLNEEIPHFDIHFLTQFIHISALIAFNTSYLWK
jgi:hypothetical protein